MSEHEEMDDFERELTRALRRVDPPETLAWSVMLGVEAEERRLNSGKRAMAGNAATTHARFKSLKMWIGAWFQAPARTGALAVILVLGIFAGEQVHARHHRQRELAQQQFQTAMQITGQALDQTRKQLAQAGLRFAE